MTNRIAVCVPDTPDDVGECGSIEARDIGDPNAGFSLAPNSWRPAPVGPPATIGLNPEGRWTGQ